MHFIHFAIAPLWAIAAMHWLKNTARKNINACLYLPHANVRRTLYIVRKSVTLVESPWPGHCCNASLNIPLFIDEKSVNVIFFTVGVDFFKMSSALFGVRSDLIDERTRRFSL